MGTPALLIEVRWPGARFHGVRDVPRAGRSGDVVAPEWPPSPFRLFQALVAGAYGGRWAGENAAEKDQAFRWLEALDPPVVAAPPGQWLQPVTHYVPNNDLDAVGGDAARVNEIRAAKVLRTTMFEPTRSVIYLWFFEGEDAPARCIAELARRLHTLGHGMDAAFAHAQVLDASEAETQLYLSGNMMRRPSSAALRGGNTPCPAPGSLDSLRNRYDAFRRRFEFSGKARKPKTLFRQPSKAHARAVVYESAPDRLVYELAPLDGSKSFAPWPFTETVALAELVRDLIARPLSATRTDDVRRYVIGRDATKADEALRLRVIPLPSIGMRHTDPAIRRVLVELPPDHPLPRGDVEWALAGRELVSKDGELLGIVLVPASDRSMLRHYGIGTRPVQTWRTVTPAALPERTARRRIDPVRLRDDPSAEAKDGAERLAEEARAAEAVMQGLRHVGREATVHAVRVQREPFEVNGARAEVFAPNTRFAKERLWHVEIEFTAPQRGPLLLGDGRYLGLGLMKPVQHADGVLAFAIASGLATDASDQMLTHALRRAVLARVQAELGAGKPLPLYFTGHEPNGAPAGSGRHAHLAFAYDQVQYRLLIIAPHLLERRSPGPGEAQNWNCLEDAMQGFSELRAGRAGKLRLARTPLDHGSDPLFASSRQWESASVYRVIRHRKCADAVTALVADIKDECQRLRLPRLNIEAARPKGIADVGLTGRARLHFATAVSGPILIGRDRHFGGGLFVGR